MGRPLNILTFYSKRMTRALHFIERNLGHPLTLAMLAEEASFSPYHFHRLFCAWHGETPQAYIRRLRLERGAAMLHYGRGENLEEIAFDCGFGSAQGFHRAFRNYFGMTPSAWRVGGYRNWEPRETTSSACCEKLSLSQVRVVTLPAKLTHFMRKIGPYNQGTEEFWLNYRKHIASLGLPENACFGVGLDDPAVTPAARCRYDLCMELSSDYQLPKESPVRSIGGGPHAILPFAGTAGQTQEHWLWLLQVWLPQSRYKIGQQACFERYLGGIPTPGPIQSELCLPLAR